MNSTKKVNNSDDNSVVVVGDLKTDGNSADDEHLLKNDRRYLQCPAAVTMWHLQKFVRMKYGLTSEHRVSTISNVLLYCIQG